MRWLARLLALTAITAALRKRRIPLLTSGKDAEMAAADLDIPLQTRAASRFDHLSEAERKLLTALPTGEEANCGPAGVAWDAPDNNLVRAETWGEDRTVRAALLEWLCTDPTAAGQVHHLGIRLIGARIDATLDLSFVKVPFPLTFRACLWPKGIRLQGATLPDLRLQKCWIKPLVSDRMGEQTAIMAVGLQVLNIIRLSDGFDAKGEINLVDADIGGSLICTHSCRIDNSGGQPPTPDGRLMALNAERATIGGLVLLRDNFAAEGEVLLRDADIGGLICTRRSRFKNHYETRDGRVALNTERAKIGGVVLLREDFQADGDVRLLGASIRRNLEITNNLATPDDTAAPTFSVILRSAKIEGGLFLGGLRCAANTVVNLEDAACDVLDDAEAGWPFKGKLILDGFVYRRLRNPLKWAQRLDWLRRQPGDVRFRPQPYRQLAGVLRAQGHDAEAKEILIGMARDRRRWADLTPVSRFWQWILWITIRNGHQPLRAGYGLLILWLIGFLAFGLGYQAQVMVPSERFAYDAFAQGTLPGQHAPFCALVYSIDTSLPIIGFGQKDRWHPRLTNPPTVQRAGAAEGLKGILCEADFTRHWDPNSVWIARSTLATSLEVYRWFHLAFGWFLATMLLAGISGLVGRE